MGRNSLALFHPASICTLSAMKHVQQRNLRMKHPIRAKSAWLWINLCVACLFALAACGTPAAQSPTAAPTMAPTMAPAPTEPMAEPTMAPTEEPMGDANTVADVAMADSQFSTLVELVIAADLPSVLNGPGPLTVFAPTNEAFAKLPQA